MSSAAKGLLWLAYLIGSVLILVGVALQMDSLGETLTWLGFGIILMAVAPLWAAWLFRSLDVLDGR